MSRESLREPFFSVPKNSWEGHLYPDSPEYNRAAVVDDFLAQGNFAQAEDLVTALASGNRIHISTINTYLGVPMQRLAAENSHEMLAMAAKQYYREEISPELQGSNLLEVFREAEASYGEYGVLLEDLTAKAREVKDVSDHMQYIIGAISETAILALFARTATLDLQEIGEGRGDINNLVLPYSASQDHNHRGNIAADILVQTPNTEIPIQIKTILRQEHYEKYNSQRVLLIGLNEIAGKYPVDNHRLVNVMLDELAGRVVSKEDQNYLEKSARRLKDKVSGFQVAKRRRRRVPHEDVTARHQELELE